MRKAMTEAERKTFVDTMKRLLLLWIAIILVYFGTEPFSSLSVLDLPIRVVGMLISCCVVWVSFKKIRWVGRTGR